MASYMEVTQCIAEWRSAEKLRKSFRQVIGFALSLALS